MAVEATDAIHIGSYTLKPRLLDAEPKSTVDPRQAEIDTRIEAVLSIDLTGGGGKEAGIDLAAGLDQRLYQEAIRRKTGAEAPKRPKSKEVAPILPELGRGETLEDSTLMAACELSLDGPEPEILEPKHPSVTLDPAVEARLRDLDELIAALDAKQMGRRMSQVPWRDPESELPARVLEDRNAGDDELNPTCEFARDLASSLAVDGQMIERRQQANVISLDARRRSTAKDRKSFDPEASTQEAEKKHRAQPPVIPSVPMTAVDPPPSEARSERSERSRVSRASPERDPMTVRPVSHSGERHEAVLLTPTEMRAQVTAVPTPPPPVAITPNKEVSDSFDNSGYDDVWASKIEDHAEALDEFKRITEKKPPPLPPPTKQEPIHSDEEETVAATSGMDPPAKSEHYDGIEIACRIGGRLADIAVLRKAGDQFILGHPTPQGSVAPAKAHVGLRLLRINEDQTVDLVFPQDVAGHLVRGSATVMFAELAEGRKYSCLRLEVRDVATVILGEGRHSISYHIRFLRRPKSLFRSLKGIGGA